MNIDWGQVDEDAGVATFYYWISDSWILYGSRTTTEHFWNFFFLFSLQPSLNDVVIVDSMKSAVTKFIYNLNHITVGEHEERFCVIKIPPDEQQFFSFFLFLYFLVWFLVDPASQKKFKTFLLLLSWVASAAHDDDGDM